MMRRIARWRLKVWTARALAYRQAFNEAWTGLDMDDYERLLTRATTKQAKWSRRTR